MIDSKIGKKRILWHYDDCEHWHRGTKQWWITTPARDVYEKKDFRTTGVEFSRKHDNNVVITVTFYDSKGIFMVQSDAWDPVRLQRNGQMTMTKMILHLHQVSTCSVLVGKSKTHAKKVTISSDCSRLHEISKPYKHEALPDRIYERLAPDIRQNIPTTSTVYMCQEHGSSTNIHKQPIVRCFNCCENK